MSKPDQLLRSLDYPFPRLDEPREFDPFNNSMIRRERNVL